MTTKAPTHTMDKEHAAMKMPVTSAPGKHLP